MSYKSVAVGESFNLLSEDDESPAWTTGRSMMVVACSYVDHTPHNINRAEGLADTVVMFRSDPDSAASVAPMWAVAMWDGTDGGFVKVEWFASGGRMAPRERAFAEFVKRCES